MKKKNNLKKLLNELNSRRRGQAQRAEDILRLIRSRQGPRKQDPYTVPIWEEQIGLWRHGKPQPITNRPMTADTWQRFKRDFIAKYNGEEVKETGFTDSEFLEWFKNGTRELHKKPSKLAALLAELHAHDEAAKGDDDEE